MAALFPVTLIYGMGGVSLQQQYVYATTQGASPPKINEAMLFNR
jgi:hypothetical protein